MFGNTVNNQCREHALESVPNESCGLIAGGEYHRITNVSRHPTNSFQLDKTEQVRIIEEYGEIQGVFHSHVCRQDDRKCQTSTHFPSYSDQVMQAHLRVPWGLSWVHGGYPHEVVWFGDETPMRGLYSRPFVYGVWDCYSFTRDWYRMNTDIRLKNYPRKWGWWAKGNSPKDYYMNRFTSLGFYEIESSVPEQVGDILVMKVGRNIEYANHLAVYLGDEWMGHHIQGLHPSDVKLSCRERIHQWLPYITKGGAVIRHKDMQR